jgi:hypothetical protein
MSRDSDFDNSFYYFYNDDVCLIKRLSRIDNIWKKALLNKAQLVTVDFSGEEEAFIDVHAERSLSNDLGIRMFRKRGE